MGLELISRRKKEVNITTEELSLKSGVPVGTLNKILSGSTKDPKLETVKSICRVLELSLNDLDDADGDAESLDARERELIKKYRFLDTPGKKAVQQAMEREVVRCKDIEKLKRTVEELREESRTIVVNLYHTAEDYKRRTVGYFESGVSAGTGLYVTEDEFESKISIPNNLKTRNVTYAIKVKGDSMEPEYLDGDIALVERNTMPGIGEIGVYIVDGDAYIKKCGRGGLISLNPNYPIIRIPESTEVVCLGRVVGKL